MYRKGSKKREGKLILTGEADNRTKNSRGLHLTRVCVLLCVKVCVRESAHTYVCVLKGSSDRKQFMRL